jgi:hypothetical protein
MSNMLGNGEAHKKNRRLPLFSMPILAVDKIQSHLFARMAL